MTTEKKPRRGTGTQTSVYLREHIVSRVKSYMDDPSDLRGAGSVLQYMSDCYAGVCREHMPEFSLAEWSAICDANNGSVVDLYVGQEPSTAMTWANVADSGPEFGDKWNLDHIDLAYKMQALPYASRIALADVVARFWASPQLNELSAENLLRQCGARISR